MRIKILILLASAALSSCIVMHSGNVSSGPLLDINDQYVDMARGEAETICFWPLGLGGWKPDGLILEAKADLFKSRPLGKNEYYSNFTVDICQKYVVGFILVHKIVVSAEVLMRRNEPADKFSGDFKSVFNIYSGKDWFVKNTDTFRFGEKVYYFDKDFKRARIISVRENVVNFKLLDSYEPNPLIPVSMTDFYSQERTVSGLKTGDKVNVKAGRKGETEEAKIQGLNSRNLLVESGGRLRVIDFSEIQK